ncbi:MAG: hypothetical protein JWM86_2569 [Thermoleophilia bacterium]|nr:hypothetical protein [Thermoleophilia bacterium]
MTPPEPATTTVATPEQTRALLETGAVVRWWQVTAFLEASGPDAATLLDGLCTQAVERIEPGTAVLGLFLDAKARIIAPALLHRLPDGPWHDPRRDELVEDAPRLLLETLPDLVEPLRAHLAKYRLRARAGFEPVDVSTVALIGSSLPDTPVATSGAWTTVHGGAHPTRAFIGSAEACASVVRDAVDVGGLALADPDTVEADRIMRGVPGLHDLLVGRMPAEVGGMDGAVALDAGCYLGQEPVARLHYRGHANRTLRRIESSGPIAPEAIADDTDAPAAALDEVLAVHREDAPEDARAVGRLTTWAPTPDGGTVALAMLRREVARGETLRRGDDRPLVVVDAPDPEPAPEP